VVPMATYQEASSPAYDEADLTKERCKEWPETGLDVQDASVEAMTWLREDTGAGVTRQRMLDQSTVRRQLCAALRQLQ
jgi:hypothetical protein